MEIFQIDLDIAATYFLTNGITNLSHDVSTFIKVPLHCNTYANLGGSLVVGRCIDTPKCGNCAINLRF